MSREAPKYKLGILTISDAGAKGERADTSGDAISEIMASRGFNEIRRTILPDEADKITKILSKWSDSGDMELVLTTGGTGLGPRDVTPEATKAVVDIEVPGIVEAIRTQNLNKTPLAALSRSVAGVRSGCLIINLPGSPQAVRECLDVVIHVIPHALEMIKGRRGHPKH